MLIKTFSMPFGTNIGGLNVLLKGLANPEGIVLCTFTEKAAFELRDRLSLLENSNMMAI
jgi:hypothetical protein